MKASQDPFAAETGASVQGRFGAVGAMKEALQAGEPCDVMIVTALMIGALRAGTQTPLGRVRTGIAVRSGSALPDVAKPEALKAALLAADSGYFPDPVRATAGIHFANVMRELGILETLQPRLRTYPVGAIAMRELGASSSANPIGCTQITEINYTPGVQLAGTLPPVFELATVYTAAVSAKAANAELAERFIALIAGPAQQRRRAAGGFES